MTVMGALGMTYGSNACPWCGSLAHHPGECLQNTVQPYPYPQHLLNQTTASPFLQQWQQAQLQSQLGALGLGGLAGAGLTITTVNPTMPAPPSPLEHTITVGDLTGWRIWRISPAGYLRSFAMDVVWLPDEPMTGKPGDYDHCGIWAFKDFNKALDKLHSSMGHALGQVQLWGETIEHELGYRSEYAKIVSIDHVHIAQAYPWDNKARRALKWLRRHYNLG